MLWRNFGMVWLYLSFSRETSLQVSTDFFWLIVFVMKHSYSDVLGLFQDGPAPIHRAWGLTEWFIENEIDVSHMLRISPSPDLNPIKHLWEDFIFYMNDMLNSDLYHHNQENTFWGNIFWKKGVHCSSTVLETYRIYAKKHWGSSGGL